MTEVPQTIQSYLDAKLGPDSEAYEALEKQANVECTDEILYLSGHGDATPALLTPAMATWYKQHVQPLRGMALNTIEAEFKAVGADKNLSGEFVERELDKLERERIEKKRSEVNAYYDKNPKLRDDVRDLEKAYNDALDKYSVTKSNNGGREPVLIPWWYFLLLGLIGVAEALINFQAFESLNFMTPAIALGSTLAVAFLLALSSHIHGAFLKQWRHFFGPAAERENLARDWRTFGFGTLGLTIVLAAVWYARAHYLADQIQAAAMIGGTAPNWVGVVGGSLVTNLAVWACGVILSIFFHDEDPAFPRDYCALQNAKIRYNKKQLEVAKATSGEFGRIDAQINKSRKELENKRTALTRAKGYIEAQALFDRMAGQDASVLSSLEAYRRSLIVACSNGATAVNVPDKIYATADDRFNDIADIKAYSAMPLKLNFL